MNSSSAFSNVLSASPVPPASSIPAQRSPADDGNEPGFKRALADVRAEREAQPKERSSKNLTAQDKSATAKTTANTEADVPLTEKTASPVCKTAESVEPTAEEHKAVAEPAENLEAVISLAVLEIQAPVEPSAVTGMAQPTITDTEPMAGEPLLEVDTALPIEAVKAQLAVEVEPQPDLPEVAAAATATATVTGDQELLSEDALTPANPAVVAAVNPVAVVAAPEVLAAAGLTPIKTPEGKLEKLSTVVDHSAAAVDESLLASDDQPASADPKAVFEKMLQAIASNAASNNAAAGGDQQKAPELAAAFAALTGESSASAPGVEPLSRSLEAQLPSARNFLVQTAIPVSVGQPSWSQAVGEKVLWLAAQNVQAAEIILDPPELGPMQVKVSVHQEQTNISFASHNPGVRDLLDQSLGRLRDMFNEQGLNLVNVDVSDKSFQRHQGEGGEQQGRGSRSEQDEEESVQAVSAIVQQRLVDHYA